MQENLIGTTCKWPPLAPRDMKLDTVNITFRGIRSLEHCYSFAFGCWWGDNFWGTKSICKAKHFRNLTCTRLTSATVRRITWIPLVWPCNICDTKFCRNFTLFFRSGDFFSLCFTGCFLLRISATTLPYFRDYFPKSSQAANHGNKLAKNRDKRFLWAFFHYFCAHYFNGGEFG